jgi:hypothetical protein
LPFVSRARLSEQSWFGLDEDAAAGQAFELGADVLDVVLAQGQVHGRGQATGAQGAADLAEDGENLLVGGVVGDRWWRRDGLDRGRSSSAREMRVLRLIRRCSIAWLRSFGRAVRVPISAWVCSIWQVRERSRASIRSARQVSAIRAVRVSTQQIRFTTDRAQAITAVRDLATGSALDDAAPAAFLDENGGLL